MAFQLPTNITAQRKPISPTSYEYILQHSELGQLGKIVMYAGSSGGCMVTYQVFGSSDDWKTEQRREIFDPVARLLAEEIRLVRMDEEMSADLGTSRHFSNA